MNKFFNILIISLLVASCSAFRQLNERDLVNLQGVPREWQFLAQYIPSELVNIVANKGRAEAQQLGLSVEEHFKRNVLPRLEKDENMLDLRSRQFKRQDVEDELEEEEEEAFVCPEVASTLVGNETHCDRSKCVAASPALTEGQCSWYQDKACCTKEIADAEYLKTSLSMGYLGEEEGSACYDLTIMRMCGEICSPQQSAVNPLDPTGKELIHCREFCEDYSSACEDVALLSSAISILKIACPLLPKAESNVCFNGAQSMWSVSGGALSPLAVAVAAVAAAAARSLL